MNNKDRIIFYIYTPAQAYTWRFIIQELIDKGFTVKILARDYGSTVNILLENGFDVSSFKPFAQNYARIFEIFAHLKNGWKVSKEFNPNIVIGFGVLVAITAKLINKPSIVFTDSEPIPFQNMITKLFASIIIAPSSYRVNLGNKLIRIASYKELAYLLPKYFKPDPSIFDDLGLAKNEKYILLRFNVFDAVHDIGRHGFTEKDQFRLVNELEKYAKVFISPEGNLSKDLEKYKLLIHPNKIHQVLYYAQLIVTDTQTMTTEAAILGTPAVRCNNFVGPKDMGVFIELEKKYNIIYSFQKSDLAIQKAIELIKLPDLKEQWAKKQEKLILDKIDFTQFMVNIIEGYPNSIKKFKKKVNDFENSISNRS